MLASSFAYGIIAFIIGESISRYASISGRSMNSLHIYADSALGASVNVAFERKILNKKYLFRNQIDDTTDHRPVECVAKEMAFDSVEWTLERILHGLICYLLVDASDYYRVPYLKITLRYWIKQLVLSSVRNKSQHTHTQRTLCTENDDNDELT